MVVQLRLEEAPLRLECGSCIDTHPKHGLLRGFLQFKSQLKLLYLFFLCVKVFDGQVSIVGSLEEIFESWLVQLIYEVVLLVFK